jgi:hypothetical protein
MRSTRLTLIGGLCMAAASSLALVACMDDGGTVDGTGGGPASGGSGAMGGTGGSAQGGTGGGTMGGTGGSTQGGTGGGTGGGTMGGTGGSAQGGTGGGSAGMMAMGGSSGSSVAGSGMTAGTGGSGAGAGGASGSSSMGGAGNAAGMGGRSNGGAAGTGVAGMSGSAGMSNPGECVKGMTKGKDVAVIGESFIAATHQITQAIEAQAKAAGALPQSDKYVDNSVSGTTLANNQIPSQYDKAVSSSGTIRYVLMDGGGNDCLINNNGDAALTAATTLFKNMADKKTEKIVYFFYPDPVGSSFASLKSCLDKLRPSMKALCDGLTAPKCYWLDLRDTWNGHAEYTSDGIHPTAEGSKATGDVIWKTMVANCVAQ